MLIDLGMDETSPTPNQKPPLDVVPEESESDEYQKTVRALNALVMPPAEVEE